MFSIPYANEKENSPLFYKQCEQETNLPFLGVEYLYWKAQSGGFVSGTILEETSPNSLKTRPLQPEFIWDSGFKISLGWGIPYDSWSVAPCYTYFRTQVSTHFNAEGNEAIAGYWTLTDELASSGTSSWKFHEDLVDVVLGKSHLIGKSCFITPYIGGRYGWLNQNFGSNLFSTTSDLGFPSLFSATQKFHGGGPLLGISSDWAMGKNFSFLSKIATSLLYGTVKIDESLSEVVNMDFDITTRVLTYTQNNQEQIPNLQLLLGASWGMCVSKTATIGLSLGWEVNYWWNQYL